MRLTPGGMVRTQADVSDIERASRAMPSSLALVVQSMSRVSHSTGSACHSLMIKDELSSIDPFLVSTGYSHKEG